jgi:hypothetical protein
MPDPYATMQHYRPGDGAVNQAITTSPVSIALTEGWWYDCAASTDVYFRCSAVTAVSAGNGEHLGQGEWSLSFQARANDLLIVAAKTGTGTAYVRRVAYGSR